MDFSQVNLEEIKNSPYFFWTLTILSIYIVYRILFAPNKAVKVKCTQFNNKSVKFEAMRRRTFPSPYPNGWYNIAIVKDIKRGEIKSVSCLGVDLVIFRGKDDKIGVLDAHCPHIGAHMGVGGKVVGNAIECPFHGWQFNKEGECVHIPYTNKDIPCVARTNAWIFREKFGLVWLWFDAEKNPPRYELEDIPEIEKKSYYYCDVLQLEFNQHISEMFENSADYHHFNTLHAPFPVPILEKFVNIHHEAQLSFPYKDDPSKKHLCLFIQKLTHVILFNLIKIPFIFPQITNVTFEGPSIMQFRIYTPLGNFHVIKTVLPVKPFQLYSEDHMWADWKVPRIYAKVIAYIIKNALEQDRLVWESKIYNNRPVLVEGDGPWKPFRNWYGQHYSPSSKDVGNNYLDW